MIAENDELKRELIVEQELINLLEGGLGKSHLPKD